MPKWKDPSTKYIYSEVIHLFCNGRKYYTKNLRYYTHTQLVMATFQKFRNMVWLCVHHLLIREKTLFKNETRWILLRMKFSGVLIVYNNSEIHMNLVILIKADAVEKQIMLVCHWAIHFASFLLDIRSLAGKKTRIDLVLSPKPTGDLDWWLCYAISNRVFNGAKRCLYA